MHGQCSSFCRAVHQFSKEQKMYPLLRGVASRWTATVLPLCPRFLSKCSPWKYQVLPALCTPNSYATVRALTEPPCAPCLEAFWRGSREALSCKSCSGNPQSHIHCVPNVSHNFLPCFSITVSVCHGVFAQAFCKPCDFGDCLTLPSSRRA